MSRNRPFSLMVLCFGGLFALGVANAAEEKAPAAATTPKIPETVKAPKPINIDLGSEGLLSEDVFHVRDDSTVRPSSDHEKVVMNLVYRCNEAIRSNNLAEAESQIKIMTQLLPRQSLTLLRMRAWYALSAGQDIEARQLYRQLLDRASNDENAGINLAILEARAGRVDEAKEILNGLSSRIPDSAQLNTVREAFGLISQQ
ncbi:MAG: tetratricopeptide repeat protein [Burkholderiales bacterium]|jgi:tetratricopeptide (TPR) repeat protein|nr:tetratricopeptide repeat protein [Burkholderiales bacterium]